MSRILFIGDYYPSFSYRARLNYFMAEIIRNKGNEVILLSKSWCMVNEENFYGGVEELSQNYPFYKKFFVDPIQIKDSKLELINGYLGLGCKIIEYEVIDEIVFADDIIYTLVVELLKYRYRLPCILLNYGNEVSKSTLDDYVIPYMRNNIIIFDKIFTYPERTKFWKDFYKVSEKTLIDSIPMNGVGIEFFESWNEKCYLWSEDNSKEALIVLLQRIKDKTNLEADKILIISPNDDSQQEINVGQINYQVKYIKDLPKHSFILYATELINGEPLDISYILTMLASDLIPMVNEKHFNVLREYNIKYMKIGRLYAIYYIDLQCDSLQELF